MSYALCFICSEQIESYFELSSKKPTTAGTLCELLQLPIRDSTLTFGQKFQQAPYCSDCVKEMKEMHELLSSLKELDKKIKQKRYQVESRLRKSCQSRRLVGENSTDEEIDDEENFHPFDYFREAVVEEINSLRNSSTFHPPEMQMEELNSSIKIESPTPLNKVVIRTGKVQNIDEPHSTDTSRITPNANIRAGPSRGNARQDPDFISNEIRHHGVTMKQLGTTCTPIIVDVQSTIGGEVKEELPDFESDPLSSSKFMSILSGDTPVEVQIDEQESDTDGIHSDAEEIFLEPTPDGRLHCPYAPVCNQLFESTDRDKFLSHVRSFHPNFHKGKPYQTTATPQKKPRSGYDIQFKLEAVAFAEEHCNAAAARQFCVDSKCIRTWKKQKSRLEAALDKRTKTPSTVRRRLPGAGRKPASAPNHSNPIIVMDQQ